MAIPPYIAQLRKHIGHDLLMYVATAGIIHNEEGKLLLQYKGEGIGWSLPSGIMEPGETPAESLFREVLEETGLEVRPLKLVGVAGGPKYRHTYSNGDLGEPTILFFTCEVTGGTYGAYTDPETKDLGYFGENELPELVVPYNMDMLFGREDSFFDR
ncbi:MAG: NUDIX domain-containing protein [Flavobacteriales bacterium]|nr:NUDIX domain-containing protein [Flavobacteriales bacterium]